MTGRGPGGGRPVTVIACGAIAAEVQAAIGRSGRSHSEVEVRPLPSLLHNRPERIAGAVGRLIAALQAEGRAVVVAYADCGTYGALDDVCRAFSVRRLGGMHCYDVFAGPEHLAELFADEPGTYLLTDFLVRSFRRTVLTELGLDRHPELWPDYFANYRRVVWLAQHPTAELRRQAESIAQMFGLPLQVVPTGSSRLADELELLLEQATA